MTSAAPHVRAHVMTISLCVATLSRGTSNANVGIQFLPLDVLLLVRPGVN